MVSAKTDVHCAVPPSSPTRANSVTWNPHKMMSVPLQCSALLVREEVCNSSQIPVLIELHFTQPQPLSGFNWNRCELMPPALQGLMQNCNQMHACYLFQQDKHYDLSYDTGDKALQCGRHVDIFKLWLMWRAKVSCCSTLKPIFSPLKPTLIHGKSDFSN